MGEARRRKLRGTYPDEASKRAFLARYESSDGTLDLGAAIERVRSHAGGAYAFIPTKKEGEIIGGSIWLITPSTDLQGNPDGDEPGVDYFSARFGATEGVEDWYSFEEAEEDLASLRFRPTVVAANVISMLDIGVALRMLEGASKKDAVAAEGL